MKLTKISPKISEAIAFFQDLHKHQTRKDGVRPYFVHLDDVADRVSQVTDDEDIIIAAIGHDSVEDIPGFTVANVREKFGEHVAKLVTELTDVYSKASWPDLNRKARKQLERERYATFSPEAKLIKLADIASNLNDETGDDGFMRMFIKEKALCLPYLFVDDSEKNLALYRDAVAILIIQKVVFDVR